MKTILIALWLTGFFAVLSPGVPQNKRPAFSVTIKAKEESAKLASMVVLEITLRNISDQEQPYVAGTACTDVEVRRDGGQPVGVTPEGNLFRGGSNSIPQPDGSHIMQVYQGSRKILTMQPSETRAEELVLSRLFDLGRPGKYTIQAKRYDLDSKTYLKSNTITIMVGP